MGVVWVGVSGGAGGGFKKQPDRHNFFKVTYVDSTCSGYPCVAGIIAWVGVVSPGFADAQDDGRTADHSVQVAGMCIDGDMRHTGHRHVERRCHIG